MFFKTVEFGERIIDNKYGFFLKIKNIGLSEIKIKAVNLCVGKILEYKNNGSDEFIILNKNEEKEFYWLYDMNEKKQVEMLKCAFNNLWGIKLYNDKNRFIIKKFKYNKKEILNFNKKIYPNLLNNVKY